VISGIAGVGKTQLARAYAEQHRGDYRIGWWVTAETHLDAVAGLSELSVRLGAADSWTSGEMLAYLFDALARMADWLLVLDNATGPGDVEEFLPRRSAGGGHVVLTSRSPTWQILAPQVDLDGLTLDQAAQVLTAHAPHSDQHDARRLAQELGRLPLALGQAAAYTAETGISTGEYLDLFRRERARLLECGSAMAYLGSVSTAITLSLDHLTARSGSARRLLDVCALYAGDPLPLREILDALAPTDPERTESPVERLQALAWLRQSGLLTIDTGESVRLHRLTLLVIQEEMREQGTRVREAVTVLVRLFPHTPSEPATWPRCAQLTTHARAAVEHACALDVVDDDLATVMTRVGRYLLCTGLDFAAARDLHAQALLQRRALHHGDHPETARCLAHLAVDLNELGDLRQARCLHEESLDMRRRLYPGDHADTAHSLDNLGNVLHRLGDVEAARDHHEQGLAMRRRLHDGDHPNIAYSLSNVAGDFRRLKDLDRARHLDEQALAMRRRLALGDHPDVAHSLSSLARDLHAVGDHPAAADLEAQALAMRGRLYPAGHPETAATLAHLADIHRAQGHRQQADDYADQARRLTLRLDAQHPPASHP
jgi:tetratricopeptide (TPR) repeat protein